MYLLSSIIVIVLARMCKPMIGVYARRVLWRVLSDAIDAGPGVLL
jgi:hypothetical protein